LDYYWPKASALSWLETPYPIVVAYLNKLPAILAAESLRNIRDAMIGSGNMKRLTAQAQIRKLERTANRGVRRRTVRAKSLEQAQAIYARMGISVRKADAEPK
jgi:hypothetical protein